MMPWQWPWWWDMLVGGVLGFCVGVLTAAKIAIDEIRKGKS